MKHIKTFEGLNENNPLLDSEPVKYAEKELFFDTLRKEIFLVNKKSADITDSLLNYIYNFLAKRFKGKFSRVDVLDWLEQKKRKTPEGSKLGNNEEFIEIMDDAYTQWKYYKKNPHQLKH